MFLGMRPEVEKLLEQVREMIRDEVMPVEEEYHAEIAKGDRWAYTKRQAEILEGLKAKARESALWNFWLTDSARGKGLTTVEYAYLAEEMGKSAASYVLGNLSGDDVTLHNPVEVELILRGSSAPAKG